MILHVTVSASRARRGHRVARRFPTAGRDEQGLLRRTRAAEKEHGWGTPPSSRGDWEVQHQEEFVKMHNVRRPQLYLVLAIPALVVTATGPVAAQTPDPVRVTVTQPPTPSPLLVGQTSIAKFTADVITPPQQ